MVSTNLVDMFCDTLPVRRNPVIEDCFRSITICLNEAYWNNSSDSSSRLFIGSYGRRTLIRNGAHLDMMFTLPSSMMEISLRIDRNDALVFLKKVRATIQVMDAKAHLREDGKGIVVPCGEGSCIDVIPSIENSGPYFRNYIVPTAKGFYIWGCIKPGPDIQAMARLNKVCRNDLFRLCHLVRAWSHAWGLTINGLRIDTLAYHFMIGRKNEEFRSVCLDILFRDFLVWLLQTSATEYWKMPGGVDWIAGIGEFRDQSARCLTIVQSAIHSGQVSSQDTDLMNWREIFGPGFNNEQ